MFHICSIHFLIPILFCFLSKDSCPFLSQKLNLYFSFLFDCSKAFDTVSHSFSWNIPSSNIWGHSSGFTFGITHPLLQAAAPVHLCPASPSLHLSLCTPIVTCIPRIPGFITQISPTLKIHIANQMLGRIWKLNRPQIKITPSSQNCCPPCSPMSVTHIILHPVSNKKLRVTLTPLSLLTCAVG